MRVKGKITFLLACLLVACTALIGVAFQPTVEVKASADIISQVEKVESFDYGKTIIFYLTQADYMTADEWGTNSNEAYKWVNGDLAYENRSQNNVCNAILDKHVDEYNYAEYILIDGVPIGNYTHSIVANKYTRVNGFGITVDSGEISSANIITVKAGCQIPSLTYSYFGVGEFSCIKIEEEISFKVKNSVWTRYYPFDGYEYGVSYDASERYFYLRDVNGNYKGHAEAPICEFTTVFNDNNWGDLGYTLASSADTLKGNLLVVEFVNPIKADEVGSINFTFFAHVPRTFDSYNAELVTENDLGETVESFKTPQGWSTVTLFAPLYANSNGMIDTLVFQFTNDGHEERTNNQVFIGEFSIGENLTSTPVYDGSFVINESENAYDIIFRFNKNGDFNKNVKVDQSKILINGVSVEDINSRGNYVQIKWDSIQKIYQLKIVFSKEYTGDGKIKNADIGYVGNKITVEEGLTFPNGEVLDKAYTCNIYAGERFVDYELLGSYEETKLTSIAWNIDVPAKNNLHFYLVFDKQVSSQIYYHACETEGWRANSLTVFKGMYDPDFSVVYVTGGFKSSLFDNVLINGKSIGEIHGIDSLATVIYVHYGQATSYTLDVCVDSMSETYKALLPLFESGEGVTIQVKSGLKFTTGIKTTQDYTYELKDSKFINTKNESENFIVFYDGIKVNNGDLITCNTEAMQSNIFVDGKSSYTVSESKDGNVTTYSLVSGENKFSFAVKSEITTPTPTQQKKGCKSSVSVGFAVALIPLAMVMIRRRRDEEK